MTVRAILIGLALGVGLACFGYFNDWVIRQAYVASDLVPVSVYGLLVLALLLANPVLRLLKSRPLRGPEWCVIASLVLVACVVPGPAVTWYFSPCVVMPHQFNKVQTAWRDNQILGYVPDVMLVDASKDFDRVVKDFKTGITGSSGAAPWSAVPWHAWSRTLSFWLPIFALVFISGICLVLVLHGQWAHRERLRYPVADFASELIGGAGEAGGKTIFRTRLFWLGFLPVLLILCNNAYFIWADKFSFQLPCIRIPLDVDLSSLIQKWPDLGKLPSYPIRFKPTLYFAAVGFAFFVSTDVSLSLGLSHFAFAAVFLSLQRSGVNIQGDRLVGGVHVWQLFGSFLGIALVLMYVGRRYYWSVLQGAFGLRLADRQSPGVIWACRIGLAAAAAMVLMLIFVLKLHWLPAVLFVLLAGLLFTVVTRISAETGLFFVQPYWQPLVVILGLFDAAALGPGALAILALLSVVLLLDPRVCLMPLVANAFRFSEAEGLKPGRLGRWMVLAVLLALVAGVLVTIYIQYNVGGTKYSWGANSVPKYPFDFLMRQLRRIEPGAVQPYAFNWSAISPNTNFLWATGVGLALVLAFSALRLRFTWWPFHPVVFLVWGSFAMAHMGPSFLLGWIIKSLVTRLGGSQAYRKAKTFFVGAIAGEFVAGVIWAAFGLAYYLDAGAPGPMFRVHP